MPPAATSSDNTAILHFSALHSVQDFYPTLLSAQEEGIGGPHLSHEKG
jgi:hypothetical protein